MRFLSAIFLTEAHIDGLEQTKYWLTGAYEKLQEAQTEGPVASTSQGNPSMATPATILNHAYLELLHWDSIEAFPEVSDHTGKLKIIVS